MSSKIQELIAEETIRQKEGIELIPSENYISKEVLAPLSSILNDKYSEGFPKARYYAGNEVIDKIELYAQELANKVFGSEHAIVQPYSGSPANLAVDLALVEVGGTILGLSLSSGGHLTHGASASYTGKIFKAINYEVTAEGKIDYQVVRQLALEHKPKLIWCGLTAYPYQLDFAKFAEIADEVGAYLAADISHIAGLVLTGEHPSPVQHVHVVTTTTHKTLRGPRGAMILVTKKGLEKDSELAEKLEKSVFPGLQGGPHNATTAAIAIALEQTQTAEYKQYIEQVVKNAKVLAEELGVKTENHLMLLDLSKYGFGLGYQLHIALEMVGITVNKNTVPHDPASPFYPSGIRIGTPAITSRGMKEEDMKKIAGWINRVIEEIKGHDLPQEQSARRQFIREFREKMTANPKLAEIKKEVSEFASQFPLPGVDA